MIKNSIIGFIIICSLQFSSSCKKNPSLSTVTTNDVSNITQTDATLGGTVKSDGKSVVFSRGVCWGTSLNPTISDNKTSDGSGTGSFTSSITGLTAGTNYHASAYATNSIGTS